MARPAPVDRVSSSTPPYVAAIERAKDLRKRGHFGEAKDLFVEAALTAAQAHDSAQQSSALLGATGCYIRLFRYREALQTADQALDLASGIGDATRAGAAAGNKAAIYYELGDWDSASLAADNAVALLEHSPRTEYLARALLLDGDAQARAGKRAEATASFQRSITLSHSANLPQTEAMADDHLGEQLMLQGDLKGAGSALEAARRLFGEVHEDGELAITQGHLAEWKYRSGDYSSALDLIRFALASRSLNVSEVPQYWLLQCEGEVLAAMGKNDDALRAFGQGIRNAEDWKVNTLSGDSTTISTVVALASVYEDYVELAARLALERHDPSLARRALQVLVDSRAGNLRASSLSLLRWHLQLPPHYFELLSTLQKLQAHATLSRNAKEAQASRAQLQRIRLELADLENKAGVNSQIFSNEVENDGHKTLLSDIQLRLRGEDLLLSFCLGAGRSYLWAVTRNQVSLYQLPAERDISTQARAFSTAVQHGGDSANAGRELSRSLFGQIPAALSRKANYLISADGALLDGVPFAALPDLASDSPAPLMAAHTLRFIPSEGLLTGRRLNASEQAYVGIADPIYNPADSRLRAANAQNVMFVNVRSGEGSAHLARLVSSEREVRTAALASAMPEVTILSGALATVANVQNELLRRPAIIHFAVHVVSPESVAPDQAALTLSIGQDGMPELLTRENIAALRVPGSLVVLSGCASQQGAVLPSAGLVGLGRAWLLAGASAVLVTSWPTPDDSGSFFSSFYQSFHSETGSVGQRAAAALGRAQREMRASSGYRSDPSFWSAFSLASKE